MIKHFGTKDGKIVLSQSNLNALVDAIRDQYTPPGSKYVPVVQNKTGSDLTALFPIVGIDEPIYPSTQADFQRNVALTGIAPTTELHAMQFAILSSPAKQNEVVEAALFGVSPVQINVTNEEHEYAKIVDDVTEYLESGVSGGCQILAKEAGTGVVWGYVRIVTGALPFLHKSTSAESKEQTITAKRLNAAGYKVGEDDEFVVVPEIDEDA